MVKHVLTPLQAVHKYFVFFNFSGFILCGIWIIKKKTGFVVTYSFSDIHQARTERQMFCAAGFTARNAATITTSAVRRHRGRLLMNMETYPLRFVDEREKGQHWLHRLQHLYNVYEVYVLQRVRENVWEWKSACMSACTHPAHHLQVLQQFLSGRRHVFFFTLFFCHSQ